MKCPVCRFEVKESAAECPNCGFSELEKTFINIEDAHIWEEKVVLPLRTIWFSSQKMYEKIAVKYDKKKAEYEELVTKYNGLMQDYNDLKTSFSSLESISPAVSPSITNPKPGWNTNGIIAYKNFNKSRYSLLGTECEISNIEACVTGAKANISFVARKTKNGDNRSSTAAVGFKWRLKDAQGVVVCNSIWCDDSLTVGDARLGTISISGINQSSKYTLEFLDC